MQRDAIGDTDALVTTKRKQGRPKRYDGTNTDDESEDARHAYLEDESGHPIGAQRLWQISLKARCVRYSPCTHVLTYFRVFYPFRSIPIFR